MATLDKDFKIKQGLIVEGTTGTIAGNDILTKSETDQEYIQDLVGGSGASTNTANTLVLRDGNGDFAAGTVTAETKIVTGRIDIGSVGYIEDDGDVVIANTNNNDIVLQGEDIRLNAQDDVRLNAGTGGDVFVNAETGTIRLVGPSIYAGENLQLIDSEKVATQGYVDDAINNLDLTFTTDEVTEGTSNLYFNTERVMNVLTGSTQNNIVIQEIGGELHITAENGVEDSTTDDLTEGTTNLYYTDARARDAFSAGNGISLSSGEISAQIGTGLTFELEGFIGINRSDVDTWYDAANTAVQEAAAAYSNATSYADTVSGTAYSNAVAYADGLAENYDPAGSANTVQGNLDMHTSAETNVHGVTGDVVGTSDSQTLTNKTIGDQLKFQTDPEAMFWSSITPENDNLLVRSAEDLNLTALTGDIILSAQSGTAYLGSATAGNEVATHSYVDNAVSGLAWKQAVNLKVTETINITGDQVGAVFDGHAALTTADAGYRFLVTDQGTASENGIWESYVDGSTLLLRRPTDADVYSELIGAAVYIMEGTQFGSTSWVQGNHYLTDFTGQDWTQFSGQGSVTAGDGITVDGLEVSIDRTTVDTWYDASGSAANAAANAISYADGLAENYDPAGSAANAYANATSYADGLATNYDAAGSAANAYSNAVSYADGLATNYDPSGSAANAYSNAVSYADNVYSSAVAYSDGLASNYDAAGSADTAYSNAISYANTLVNGLTSDDIEEGLTNHYYTDGRAKTAAANLLTSAILSNITITGDGEELTITAENGVGGSTTDDLAEGSSNLYFTDSRAQNAVANNITSAIDALDTDDIEEGSSNLYFTDSRAQDAVANNIASAIAAGDSTATPEYEAMDITWATKQVGSYTLIETAGTATVYSWNAANYPSAKFLVRVRTGQHSQVSEVLLTKDNNGNVAITEYAIVYTNGVIGDISATYSNDVYNLTVNATENSTEVIVSGMLLAYGD